MWFQRYDYFQNLIWESPMLDYGYGLRSVLHIGIKLSNHFLFVWNHAIHSWSTAFSIVWTLTSRYSMSRPWVRLKFNVHGIRKIIFVNVTAITIYCVTISTGFRPRVSGAKRVFGSRCRVLIANRHTPIQLQPRCMADPVIGHLL